MRDDREDEPLPRDLAQAIETWKASAPEPRAEFAERMRRVLSEPAPAASQEGIDAHRKTLSWPLGVGAKARRFALAASAVLVLLAGPWLLARSLGWIRVAPSATPGTLLAADALREVEAAESAHLAAVARLAQAAEPILARAGDAAMPAREAAILLAHRDRLRFLDRTLDEVEAWVESNPYHAKARAVRIAALREKTELLLTVVALEASTPSISAPPGGA